MEAVCPSPHPLGVTSAVARIRPYHDLAPLRSVASAIAATKPDLIVPGDDLATRHLHDLYSRELRHGNAGAPLCGLIERSLGAHESFPVVFARTHCMDLAGQEGIRVPQTEVIANSAGLGSWIARMGFPTVLKANGSSGGNGVRVVHTQEDAEQALRTLQAPPLLARAVKRALLDRDKTLLAPSLLRRRSVVNAQVFVAGREATSAVACWNGEVLAALHFEVVNKTASSGHATVLRVIENAEMAGAAEKMVRRLKLSGLHGFDFMLETQTGHAYLIELNPRATQVGHLTLGPGRDLPAALYAALSRSPIQPAAKLTGNQTIALFPQEWIRDTSSSFLKSAYHDVPWEEPELVNLCVRSRRQQSAWYAHSSETQTLSPAPPAAAPKVRV